jgi:hypothetical protein
MSIKSMTWAFSQPLSGNEKVVLLALADFADDDGKCWPSMPLIAEKSYLSVRTVQRIVLSLSDQGYLFFERRESGNGRPTSSLYRLIFDGDNLSPLGKNRNKLEVTLLSPYGDTVDTIHGDTVVTIYEPSIEPSVEIPPKREGKNSIGSRIPENFIPNDVASKVAVDLNLSNPAFQSELDNFLDYWRSVPGAKGRKLDWQATFRVWLRKSVKFKTGFGNGKRNERKSIADLADARLAEIESTQAREF